MIALTGASPFFIIGCGRSGTTIFGTALGQHPAIAYLNEPRHLWSAAYPETDIWSHQSMARGGKLLFTEADVDPSKAEVLRRLFAEELTRSGRPVLVEKLPINNFRLRFLQCMFSGARYIHIFRNGMEVARSIEALCQQGRWYRQNPRKWDLLAEYAHASNETRDLPALCTDDFLRGLLEWRLSTEAAVSFLRGIPGTSWTEISYATLLSDPAGSTARVLSFMGLPESSAVREFVVTNISRRSAPVDADVASELEMLIGGPFLPVSMAGGSLLMADQVPKAGNASSPRLT